MSGSTIYTTSLLSQMALWCFNYIIKKFCSFSSLLCPLHQMRGSNLHPKQETGQVTESLCQDNQSTLLEFLDYDTLPFTAAQLWADCKGG